MLYNDLYTFLSKETISENTFSANIILNEEHDIFKGHFPDNPILPGVCMLQMIKDLLEDRLQKSIQLHLVTNVKLLAVVDPKQNPELTVKINCEIIDKNTYKINGIISCKEVVFLKIINAEYLIR